MKLQALSVSFALYPGIFLVLCSARGWINPRAIARLQGLGEFNDYIGTRSRDLPSYSIVPQPSRISRSPDKKWIGSEAARTYLTAGSDVLSAMVMKRCVFSDTKPCGPCSIPSFMLRSSSTPRWKLRIFTKLRTSQCYIPEERMHVGSVIVSTCGVMLALIYNCLSWHISFS